MRWSGRAWPGLRPNTVPRCCERVREGGSRWVPVAFRWMVLVLVGGGGTENIGLFQAARGLGSPGGWS